MAWVADYEFILLRLMIQNTSCRAGSLLNNKHVLYFKYTICHLCHIFKNKNINSLMYCNLLLSVKFMLYSVTTVSSVFFCNIVYPFRLKMYKGVY